MKKIVFILLLLLICIPAQATTVLYRISSGEIIDISSDGSSFDDYNITYYGVLTDPTFSDGQTCRDTSGELRVIGYAKINDNGTVRNATQGEIDTFRPYQVEDSNKIQTDKAKLFLVKNPAMRKFVKLLIREINILRSQHGLADRTFDQLKNAMDKDD